MAGKMTTVQYVADDGNTYALRMDESNAVSVGAALEPTPATHSALKKGWYPRHLLAEYIADPLGTGVGTIKERRKVICPDPTEAVWVGGTTTVSLPSSHMPPAGGQTTAQRMVNFTITARIGEKRTTRGPRQV